MQIANPIYDSVFKYLFKDNKIAKLFISAIIGEKIKTLKFGSTETVSDLKYQNLTVYRLDFTATIETPEGAKQVIIEIQKAKFPGDIMRFRKYLAEHYASAPGQVSEASVKYGEPIPIISIYFLGHKLRFVKAPVIKVARQYIDLESGETINQKEVFIESLTHDSYVIQIPYLEGKRKTDLLRLLSVFDQSQVGKDYHILNVKEEDFPKKYRSIIRRLQKVILEPKIRKDMDVEDEVVSTFMDMERKLASKDQIISYKDKQIDKIEKVIGEKKKEIGEKKKEIGEKKKEIGEKEKEIGEKEKVIGEKEKVIEEKDETIREKDKEIDEKDKLIEELKRKLERME